MYILHYPRDKASENLKKLEYEGTVETKIVGLRASGMVHTTRQRDGPKGFVQERKVVTHEGYGKQEGAGHSAGLRGVH